MSVVNYSLSFISFMLVMALVYIGKDILIPLVIAFFFWYLINGLAQGYRKLLPQCTKLSYLLSSASLLLLIWMPVELTAQNIPKVIAAAPMYQENLIQMLDSVLTKFDIEHAAFMEQLKDTVNLKQMATKLAEGLTSFAANLVMILVYMAFLFMEQSTFDAKIKRIFTEEDRYQKVKNILNRIYHKVQTYLWIKTLMSFITGVISYAVMKFVGLDYAAFWAVIIFFLNYIPNIGSVLGTTFPVLLSLVQFDNFVNFFIILIGVGATQFLVGNVLEPKIMGKSLNLSPLVILLSLVVWGNLWGVAGMYLSVPIMAIAMLVLNEFKKTKPIAVWLSANGKV